MDVIWGWVDIKDFDSFWLFDVGELCFIYVNKIFEYCIDF